MLRSRLRSFWHATLHRAEVEQAISDELRFHLSQRAEDLAARRSISFDDAMRLARVEFGSVERYKDEVREILGIRRLDLTHLFRSIRRSPASAAAAVLALSLTMGAGASIFAVVDAVLLTPPPFADPERLVVAGEVPAEEHGTTARAVTYATFAAWRERARAMASLEAFDGTNLTLTGLGSAERISATDVTPGFLALLGVRPALGRLFDADDAGRPLAIVSHDFWRGKLAGDPAVVGREIVLGGRAHTIAGVLPERFTFALNVCDVWRPLPVTAAQAARSGYRVRVVARLAPNGSPAALTAALDDVSLQASPPARASARPVSAEIAGDATRTLGLLAAAAAIAMLAAFTNIAGLLIVRSIDRRRELAVRSALGARRSEIARQLLIEALALVAAGAIGGVLLAVWTTPAVGRLALQQFGSFAGADVIVSWRVIAGIGAAALACAGICVSLPAVGAARWRIVDVLRRGATPSPRELTLRRVFVAAEVALAFMLLVSMALVGRTMLRIVNESPGFDARGVLTLQLSLPAAGYSTGERVVSFYSALQSRLEERLGTAAIVDEAPLTGDRGRTLVSLHRADPAREAVMRTASPSYFDVMRIPVVSGRPFGAADDASASPRVVITQSLAERLFGRADPVYRQIWLSATQQAAAIIGVVGDVKHRALDEPLLPTVYLSALQTPSRSSVVVVRSARPDADVAAAVREEAARLDPSLPVYGVRSMRDLVAQSPGVPSRRLLTAAFIGFGGLALVLSAVGLFGVAAHDVACRRAELALRAAVGADPMNILRTTLARSAVMVGSGLAAGGVLSIWAVQALGGLIIMSPRFDVLTTGAAGLMLIATGAAAVLPAALRAARTDPLIALRSD